MYLHLITYSKAYISYDLHSNLVLFLFIFAQEGSNILSIQWLILELKAQHQD